MLHPHWCPEHCRIWHMPRAGEEQNRGKDWATAWNTYQSSKQSSELFRYLPKIPVFCFQKKDKIIFFFTPKPLKFYIFWMQGCKKGNKDQLSQHLASPTPPIYRSTSRLWVNNSKLNFLPYSASYNLLFLVQHDSIPKHTIFHSCVFHVPLLHVNKHISWVLLPLPSNRGSQLMLAGIRISWKLLLKSQASHLK